MALPLAAQREVQHWHCRASRGYLLPPATLHVWPLHSPARGKQGSPAVWYTCRRRPSASPLVAACCPATAAESQGVCCLAAGLAACRTGGGARLPEPAAQRSGVAAVCRHARPSAAGACRRAHAGPSTHAQAAHSGAAGRHDCWQGHAGGAGGDAALLHACLFRLGRPPEAAPLGACTCLPNSNRHLAGGSWCAQCWLRVSAWLTLQAGPWRRHANGMTRDLPSLRCLALLCSFQLQVPCSLCHRLQEVTGQVKAAQKVQVCDRGWGTRAMRCMAVRWCWEPLEAASGCCGEENRCAVPLIGARQQTAPPLLSPHYCAAHWPPVGDDGRGCPPSRS